MDCMRLFTKEDVLDGDEKPVSHPSVIISKRPLWEDAVTSKSSPGVTGFTQSSPVLFVMSFRHAVAAEPGNGV